jgi:hypothetical protein
MMNLKLVDIRFKIRNLAFENCLGAPRYLGFGIRNMEFEISRVLLRFYNRGGRRVARASGALVSTLWKNLVRNL